MSSIGRVSTARPRRTRDLKLPPDIGGKDTICVGFFACLYFQKLNMESQLLIPRMKGTTQDVALPRDPTIFRICIRRRVLSSCTGALHVPHEIDLHDLARCTARSHAREIGVFRLTPPAGPTNLRLKQGNPPPCDPRSC